MNSFHMPPILTAALSYNLKPPYTEEIPVKEKIHGYEIIDPYRWLEEGASQRTRKWIEQQNKYTEKIMNQLPSKADIKKRLIEMLDTEEVTIPRKYGNRQFYRKKRAGDKHFKIYVKENHNERLLVDPLEFGPEALSSVSILEITDDGKFMAFSVRRGGEDETTVRFLNVDTGELISEELSRSFYVGVDIDAGKKNVCYSTFNNGVGRTCIHRFGTEQKDDTVVFGEGLEPGNLVYSHISQDKKYLIYLVFQGAVNSRVYVQNISGEGDIQEIVPGMDARFEGTVFNDVLFLQTNWKASNKRIIAIDLKNPSRESWKEIIPETEKIIESFAIINNRIVINYSYMASSKISIFMLDGSFIKNIELPDPGSVNSLWGKQNGSEFYFSYHSFYIPDTIYKYDFNNEKLSIWHRKEIDIDKENFTVKQAWYKSKDGTSIPMFLVHNKNIELNGNNPVMLNGYGGFNLSITPRFQVKILAWLENGGIFALPSLRGGGEFGEKWHRAGMLHKKQNVFDDFIAAAQWLIKKKYTSPSRLAIVGRSNGGLLVGAAMTQRPDLFQAVVCGYPLLDMVRYHEFLIARFWVPEYGSSEEPHQMEYLLKYSPYHNVKKG
ncbi:MAG: prolyl oligopeptidase family serine peptidase, partial [Vulcanimicrobiota bacterium]